MWGVGSRARRGTGGGGTVMRSKLLKLLFDPEFDQQFIFAMY